MADVSPFAGFCYNRDKIKNLAEVVTPPYDVISPEEQDAFYHRHPQNCVRLDFGKILDTDTPEENRYTRASAFFKDWREEEALVRSELPAYYISAVDFTAAGKSFTRYGLTARVGLEPFEKKIVLPHERTFSKVKTERLELMKACRANFSPVFSIYPDTGEILADLKGIVAGRAPDSDLVDDAGHRHRMWHVSDKQACARIQSLFTDKQIFIADGHHRYETALNYRKHLSETLPGFSDAHPANWIMMYLCGMGDPGLAILPTHRVLNQVSEEDRKALVAKAADYFEVTPYDAAETTRLIADLRKDASRPSFGVLLKDTAYLFRLKEGLMDRLFGEEIPAPLRKLDVTVLTRVVFMAIMGYDEARLDDEKTISYASEDGKAVAMVASGKGDVAFILNSTPIEQVQEVAQAGLVMPRKSTYFYPKVITGQVMNFLED